MSVPIWEIGKNKTPFLTELGRTQAINNLLEIYIRFACYEIDLFLFLGLY